jgi:putative hydrolase of the HAD superfamily
MGDYYLKILPTKTALKPFAKELLDYLSSKYPLTLISNGFREVQYKKIRSCQIENYFSFIVLSEDAKALKPDARIFEYALELNQAKPQETIMIGDSYIADILGAKNAGIDQVYVKNNTNLSAEKFDCTYQISHLKEVLEIL